MVFVQVLAAAEADETRQSITLLVAALVGVAIALALLTTWYWFYTDPKRRFAKELAEIDLDDVGPGDDGSTDPRGPVDSEQALVAADASSAVDEWLADLMAPEPDEVDLVESTPIEVERDGAPVEVEPAFSSDERAVEVVALGDESIDASPADAVALGATRLRAIPQQWDQLGSDSSSEPLSDGDRQVVSPDQGGDELAVARRRREELRSGEGLSDEAWASVQRKVFNQLDRR